ncbi:MAG: hypothetical protein JSV76_01860 [Candidatus Bathyarchaeota archaeon]|nr:MAG: hypothetical protein JSV76_01860 [Candidatus Bathyarchaeota archaeon]
MILEATELDQKELFTRVSGIRQAGEPAALSWADGYVFFATPTPIEIREVGQSFIKGTMYLNSIDYSTMQQYKPFVEAGIDRIPVLDQSKDRISKAIVKWIKARLTEMQ